MADGMVEAVASGWHPADIKAALAKAGWTLTALSLAHGLPAHACRHALRYPYFEAELVIAEALGRGPRQIWPSRYTETGETKHPSRRIRLKITAARVGATSQKREAA